MFSCYADHFYEMLLSRCVSILPPWKIIRNFVLLKVAVDLSFPSVKYRSASRNSERKYQLYTLPVITPHCCSSTHLFSENWFFFLSRSLQHCSFSICFLCWTKGIQSQTRQGWVSWQLRNVTTTNSNLVCLDFRLFPLQNRDFLHYKPPFRAQDCETARYSRSAITK